MSAADEAIAPYCPKCGTDLAQNQLRGYPVESCGGCGGLWFNPAKLNAYLKEQGGGPGPSEIRSDTLPGKTDLECPSCWDEGLDHIRVRGIELEQCPRCRGIFLDSGEIDALARQSKAHRQALDQLMTTGGKSRKSGGLETLTVLGDVADLVIGGVVGLLLD